jgi:hypothetical protein
MNRTVRVKARSVTAVLSDSDDDNQMPPTEVSSSYQLSFWQITDEFRVFRHQTAGKLATMNACFLFAY